VTIKPAPTAEQLRRARANWRQVLRESLLSLVARRAREAEELRLQLTRLNRQRDADKPGGDQV